jgi:hypothetical protein
LGSNNNRPVLFETNNIERGRITNTGLWGINTTTPTTRLHVNSVAGQDPLRADVNGQIKLYVNSGGGVSVGSGTVPPANGLFVSGSVGIGTNTPSVKLQVTGGSDVNPNGGGFIVAGSVTGGNMAIDENEIMARNNGTTADLFLNQNGGNLVFNGTNGAGNMGIRTTTPAVEFHMLHGVGDGSTHGLRIENNGGNGNNWTIYTQNSGAALELYFDGAFRGSFNSVSGTYTPSSDARRKKDIEKAPDILSKVMQLDIKKYHFLENSSADKKYFGLLAQDVEKIFPEIVFHHQGDDGREYYTIDYGAYGVLAIKALQEQQEKITSLEDRIARLEAALANSANSKNINGITLEQNQPNPFSQATIIRYKIPEGADAQIMIYDASGKLAKAFQATQTGETQINARDLKAGTYTYNLIVNGKLAISKKMVLMQ